MRMATLALTLALTLLAGCTQGVTTQDYSPVSGDQAAPEAYEERQSGVQMSGEGVVERILADDTDGDRHQRFILRLSSGQTLLITHNIDLAPRVASLQTGDPVEFKGVYEWNEEGGVVHWTHHDPDGEHEPGWLKHEGMTYE